MIRLTRISHTPVVLNSDLIEHIESTPDTVISLTTGQKVVVLETTDEVIRRVIEFRRLVAGTAGCVLAQEAAVQSILNRTWLAGSERPRPLEETPPGPRADSLSPAQQEP